MEPRREAVFRAQLRSGALRTQLHMLTQELEELREENARLRMDATRPQSLRKAGDDLLAVADAFVVRSVPAKGDYDGRDQDELDDAWQRLAEVRQLRAAVSFALSELQAACAQLLSKLELGVGSMEIDRRSRGRTTSVSNRRRRATTQGTRHD